MKRALVSTCENSIVILGPSTPARTAVQLVRLTQCLIVAFALTFLSARQARAQATPTPLPTGIEGVVVDSAGKPLRGARLVVRDTSRTGTAALRRTIGESDSLGVFRILGLPAGAHVLEVQRDEYEPAGFRFDIATGVTAKIRITLVKDPLWAEMQRAADSIRLADRADSIAQAAAPVSVRGVGLGLGALVGKVATPNGLPVSLAQVQAMGTKFETQTDSAGRFRLTELPVGPYFLRARKLGYEPVVFSATIVPRDSVDAVVVLIPFSASSRGTRLDTVRVSADFDRMSRRLRGFEDRKRTARGLYISQAEITARNPQQLSDLLRGRANVTVQRNSASGDTQIFGPRLSISSGYCPLALIIDGTLINNAQGSIDALIPVTMVAAIEVYNSGTSVPGEFQRLGTDCGAIIVWTK